MRQAIARADASALERAVHKIRGSVTNFGARKTYDVAFRLEQMAITRDLGGAAQAGADLEAAVSELQVRLSAFSEDSAA
jgi:HPt (histidine-containing phosphotransfer) domain-containing protein